MADAKSDYVAKKIYSFSSDDCTFADWINQPPPLDAPWSLNIEEDIERTVWGRR